MRSEAQRYKVHYGKWISFAAIACSASILIAAFFGFFESNNEFGVMTYLVIVISTIATIAATLSLRYPVKAISFDQHGIYLGLQTTPIPWRDVDAVFMAEVPTRLGRLARTRSRSPAICIAISSKSEHCKDDNFDRDDGGHDYHYFCHFLETDGARACQDIAQAMDE